MILLGVAERSMYKMLMPKQHSLLEHVMHDLKRRLRLEKDRREMFGKEGSKTKSGKQWSIPKPNSTRERNGGMRAPERDSQWRLKCFNYNECADYLAMDCPKEKRMKYYTQCEKYGHGKRECKIITPVSNKVPKATFSVAPENTSRKH